MLATFLASFLLMALITARTGFTRLLGLGHVLWVPLVAFLVLRLDAAPATGAYGLWLRAVVALNLVSLAFDAVDVVRYACGQRGEVAPGS